MSNSGPTDINLDDIKATWAAKEKARKDQEQRMRERELEENRASPLNRKQRRAMKSRPYK